MRTYFPFKIVFIFTLLLLAACSKKEDPLGVSTETLTLTLMSDAGANETEVLAINQSVNFTVMGNDGENYTSTAKIYVNDTEIQGPSYTFTTVGTYTVKALFESVASNVLNFEVIAGTDRVVTIDVTRAMNNQTITFGLLDSDGNNTAAEATFYVDNSAIAGFTYSSAIEAEYEVYAEYVINGETFTSSIKEFSIYVPKRNVVLEDYTGTWCGYCLKALVAIDTVMVLANHHVSVVAIHESSIGPPDPMDFAQIDDLQAEFDVPDSFPQTQLNRTVKWNATPPSSLIYDMEAVTSIAGLETDLSVAISSQISGSTLSVDAKVIYRNGSEPGDKLVVYLLESGIIADQVNYFNSNPASPYFGMGNPIVDFVHNDALRNSLSGLFGDAIPETAAFEEYKKTYTFSIPSEYNADNLSFVVMVVKADNSAKNSQHADLGETKIYN